MVPSSFFYPSIMYSPTDFDKYDEPQLHMQRLMKTHLIDFDLPIRVLLPLETAGITRLGHLVAQSRSSLLSIHMLGRISLEKIEAFLAYHGFSLKEG